MNNNLNGKTAIVCGSTDGIGKSIANLMANRGCEIILVARNQDKLDTTLSELMCKNYKIYIFLYITWEPVHLVSFNYFDLRNGGAILTNKNKEGIAK